MNGTPISLRITEVVGICSMLILLLVVLQASVAVLATANPLTGNSSSAAKESVIKHIPTNSVISTVITRISFLQMQIKKHIATHVRNFKKDGNIIPLLPLFVLAFVYGVVHAAGPGHGKAIAMTYILANGRGYRSALLLGAMIAVIHAGSAILLVFFLQVVLDVTISTNMESAIRITQMVSYALICLIGLYILISSIKSWHKREQNKDSCQKETVVASPLSAAATIGMVPCPGVMMILLFCLSLGQSILGFLLCCVVSIGMALTISVAVGISLTAKKIVFKLSTCGKNRLVYAEHILHCFSGVVLTAIGGLLLLAS